MRQASGSASCVNGGYALTGLDIVGELSLFDVLHDQEVVLLGLDHFVQLHDVRVPHAPQDLDLAPHSHAVVVRRDFLFLEHLDRDLFLRLHVHGLLHFAERALAQVPQDHVRLALRTGQRHRIFRFELL